MELARLFGQEDKAFGDKLFRHARFKGGGSGGGYAYPGNSGNGGSGIVVIRYKFQ